MVGRELGWMSALSCTYWLAVGIVDPTGELPLNDDWGYAPAVRALVEDGVLRFTDWQSMPLLTHVLWGALFAWPLGATHAVLRFAVLVAGWLSVLAMYWLMRELRAPRLPAAVGAALVLANPIHFALAHSFMTDVPFVALLVAGSAAWIRGEREDDARFTSLAVALALLATLDRQLGLALPFAWIVAGWIRRGPTKHWMLQGVLPAVLIVVVLAGYERALESAHGLPALYHEKSDALRAALGDLARLRGLRGPVERGLITWLYLGLFTLPLSLLVLDRTRWRLPAVGAAVGLALAVLGARLPLLPNVLLDMGVGPRTAPGITPGAPAFVFGALTVLAGAGAGALLEAGRGLARHLLREGGEGRLWRRLPRGLHAHPDGYVWLFTALVALIAFLPPAIAYGPYFDRYVLVQLPFACGLVWAGSTERPGPPALWAVSAVTLALALSFSIGATHDYLAWQRARWRAVAWLEARDVPREDIWGGFEVDNAGRTRLPLSSREKARYVVAVSPIGGADAIAGVAVRSWLPYAIDAVWVLRRDAKRPQ